MPAHPLSSTVDIAARPRDPQGVNIAACAADKTLRPPVVVVGVYSAPESLGNPQSELHPLRVTCLTH